jgi:iron complex outermembrane recepter protein
MCKGKPKGRGNFSFSVAVIITGISVGSLSTMCMADNQELEEVIITARQRVESVQETPISVSVVSGEAVTDLNFVTSQQLAAQAPNVVMVQGYFGLAAPIISIRGVTNADFSATSNSPVAFYADDVVINSIQAQGFALFDVESVATLRGPQGTLFGRNSTSGAILVHSATPTEEVTGYVRASYGNFDTMRFEGALSGPVVENALLGRVSSVVNKGDGKVRNTALARNEGNVDNYAVRAFMELIAIENFDALFKIQYMNGDGEGVVFFNSRGDNLFTPQLENGGGPTNYKTIESGLPVNPEQLQAWQSTLKLVYALGNDFTLTAITGWLEHEFAEANDDDGTLEAILHESFNTEQEQRSQEFRFNYIRGAVDIVFGAYYMNEDIDSISGWESSYLYNLAGVPGRYGSASALESNLETWGTFFHLKYDINEQWSLSGGMRYTEDKREMSVVNAGLTSILGIDHFDYIAIENHIALSPMDYTPSSFETKTVDKAWDEVSGDVGLQYQIHQSLMAYVGYSRGFKGGSFNSTPALIEDVVDVSPEVVDALEIGIKSRLFDNRLEINAAAYYYNYYDFQAFEYVARENQVNAELFSVDEARGYGAELEISWLPTENLSVDMGLGYTDTEVQKISSAPIGVKIANGNEFRNAPKLNVNGMISYQWLLPGDQLSLSPQMDFYYIDEYFSSFVNEPGSIAGAYWNINFRLQLADVKKKVTATIWVENAFDDELLSSRYPSNFNDYGTDFATAGPRRTYGLTLGYNF